MSAKYAIAVDIGATNVRLGLVTRSGEIVGRGGFESVEIREQAKVAAVLAMRINDLLSETGIEKSDCAGVGLGAPGPLDAQAGIIEFAPNFPDWKNLPLVDQLSPRLTLPVVIENDVSAQALGEATFGAGRGVPNFLLCSIGTGFGSGLIVDGKLYTGYHGVAPELGHVTVDPEGPLCSCGRKGCLEAYLSGSGIVRIARQKAEQGASSLLVACGGDLDKLDAKMVAHAAGHHSHEAVQIFERAGWALGTALANVINFFDPGLILIGGKIALAAELFEPAMHRVLDKRVFSEKAKSTEIFKADLIDEAGLYGSAALVFNLE
jgi:glucokinase